MRLFANVSLIMWILRDILFRNSFSIGHYCSKGWRSSRKLRKKLCPLANSSYNFWPTDLRFAAKTSGIMKFKEKLYIIPEIVLNRTLLSKTFAFTEKTKKKFKYVHKLLLLFFGNGHVVFCTRQPQIG